MGGSRLRINYKGYDLCALREKDSIGRGQGDILYVARQLGTNEVLIRSRDGKFSTVFTALRYLKDMIDQLQTKHALPLVDQLRLRVQELTMENETLRRRIYDLEGNIRNAQESGDLGVLSFGH
jgi:hypothetical protein